jgi:ribosome-binding protein aMBF1 (putative translation factor)
VFLLQLTCELVDASDHVQRRADGAVRIVLVRDRRAEEREHRVPLELGDRAFVAKDGRRHDVERLIDDLRPVFRVHPLGQGCGANHVGEQGGNRFAFAGQLGSAHLFDERSRGAVCDARLALGVVWRRLGATQGLSAIHAKPSVRRHGRVASWAVQANRLDGHGQILVRTADVPAGHRCAAHVEHAASALVRRNSRVARAVRSGRSTGDKLMSKSRATRARHDCSMGTRETRVQRGRRHGDQVLTRVIGELRTARELAGVSQRTLANELAWSQSEVNRLEPFRFHSVSFTRLCEISAVLGLELSASLHPAGDAVRDRGHQKVRVRVVRLVADPPYVFTHEAAFPAMGDLRSWDLLLSLDDFLVGIEIESRVRDIQACVRRVRAREREGGVDAIVLVLADTAHNRRIVGELREALGPRFATDPRAIVRALGSGRRLPGSGVILV